MLVTTKEMFEKAMKEGSAIGAFNVNNMEIVQAIMDAAAEENGPSEETVDFEEGEPQQDVLEEPEDVEAAAEEDYEGALVKVQTGLVTYPKSAELQGKADEHDTAAAKAQRRCNSRGHTDEEGNHSATPIHWRRPVNFRPE